MESLGLFGANLLLSFWIAGGFVLLLLLVREERKPQPVEALVPVALLPEEKPTRPLLDGVRPDPPEADPDVIWERRPRDYADWGHGAA